METYTEIGEVKIEMGLGTFNLPCSQQVLGDVSSGPLNGSNKQESTNNLDNSFELLFIFTV